MEFIRLSIQMIKYNIRIVFGNKLLYFLIASLLIFVAIVIGNLASGDTIEMGGSYSLLVFIGGLLLFYPITFGIQNDKDARTLEIIFGIPDYRYRVWLFRLGLIYFLAFGMLMLFGYLLHVSFLEIPVLSMVSQVMFPLVFLGMLAFLLSTLVKSGNGTAVIVIILCFILLISIDFFENKFYNVFFNPFDVPSGTTQVVWESLTLKSHIFLAVGSLVFLLGGLLNLQEREKFLG